MASKRSIRSGRTCGRIGHYYRPANPSRCCRCKRWHPRWISTDPVFYDEEALLRYLESLPLPGLPE